MFSNVDNEGANECAVGDCSRRQDHRHKMHSCRVVALFWVRPNHHEQQNGEQKGWEHSKLGCTVCWDNMVPGHGNNL